MESHLLVSFFSSVSCATGSFCLGTTIAPLASCLDSQSVPHTAAAYLKPKPDPVTPLINPSRTSCDVKDQDITPTHSGCGLSSLLPSSLPFLSLCWLHTCWHLLCLPQTPQAPSSGPWPRWSLCLYSFPSWHFEGLPPSLRFIYFTAKSLFLALGMSHVPGVSSRSRLTCHLLRAAFPDHPLRRGFLSSPCL